MLGQAGETEFDLRFYFLGIPVRVHPFFWLMGAFVVWRSTDDPRHRFLGVLCVFVSILVHELGHAITLRRYGYPSQIVLYAMGGYATSTRLSTWKNVWVSFAGPLAGFLLYGVVRFGLYVTLRAAPHLLDNDAVRYCIGLLLWINLYWGLLNLVPCLPLDGGHIMQALVSRYFPRRAPERILQISIVASGAVALYAVRLMPGSQFLLILFGILCAQSVIAYNELQGRR